MRWKTLKITDVKASIVEGNFDWLLVCVETDEGLNGIGECYSPYYSYEVKALVSSLKDKIIGLNPLNISLLTYAMGLGRTSS